MLDQWAHVAVETVSSFAETLWLPYNRAAVMLAIGFGFALVLGLAPILAAFTSAKRKRAVSAADGPHTAVAAEALVRGAIAPGSAPTAGPSCAVNAYLEILWLTPQDARATAGLRALGEDGARALARLTARKLG